jgi:GNAT superfamily N-acetyltransferase
MPKIPCKIVIENVGKEEGFRVGCVTPDGRMIGSLIASKYTEQGTRDDYFFVGDIAVHPEFRRLKIATRIYEEAAKEACKRGLPLASYYRSGHRSQAFWEKQIRKGRAKAVSDTRGRASVGRGLQPAPLYVLPCPPPASLDSYDRRFKQ